MRDPEPVTYLAWARAAAEARVRFIVMDFIGTPLEGKTLPAANAFLAAIGLSVHPVWVEASPDLRLVM